uniref:Uncharacterized protein n=1 Tax=Daphnia magna TaxID=35525 RepID=A0A0P6IW31_9CRUS
MAWLLALLFQTASVRQIRNQCRPSGYHSTQYAHCTAVRICWSAYVLLDQIARFYELDNLPIAFTEF